MPSVYECPEFLSHERSFNKRYLKKFWVGEI
jgi:hypothetical protein